MALLTLFVAQMGDFEFSGERQADGTVIWYRKVLNVSGAATEELESVDDVPVSILRAFAQAQVEKQIQSASN